MPYSIDSGGRALRGLCIVTMCMTLWVGCDRPSNQEPAKSARKQVKMVDRPSPDHKETDEVGDWTSTVAEYLDEKYPRRIIGMANNNRGSVVDYIARYPAQDHLVYVTDGASALRFPHEFVMRIRFDTESGRLDERAPGWPDLVLAEMAEVESRTQRLFTPGDFLQNMTLDGVELPYHHFVVYKDPQLEPLDGPGSEPLFFLQVIPLTDAQLAEFKATPDGAASEMMTNWSKRDPLFLVDAASEGAMPPRR